MKLETTLTFVLSAISTLLENITSGTQSLFQIGDSLNYLPPNMMALDSPNYIFSGFKDSFVFNIESKSCDKILVDLEEECSMSNLDEPYFSRLYIDSETEAYYYCPKLSQIYRLNPQDNFSKSENVIAIKNESPFSEVRFLRIPGDDNTLLLLGLITKKNIENVNARNYTASYTVSIDLASSATTKITKVSGAHREPIVDMKMAADGNVIAIGEKLYIKNQKLNTYYIGLWSESTFDQVVDFYLSKTHSFIPHVKLTADGNFIIYTNQESIFSYDRATSKINQYKNVTAVSKTYQKDDGSKWVWEEIAFTISSSEDSVYVYSDKNFVELQISNMQQSRLIPMPDIIKNSTSYQFYFLKNNSQDTSLIQYDGNNVLLDLSQDQYENTFNLDLSPKFLSF